MSNLNQSTKLMNDIKGVLNNHLNQENVPSDFEGLWEDYTMKKNGFTHKKIYKILVLAAAITCISVTALPAAQSRRQDCIEIPFTSDEQLLGRWESVDFVKTIDDFNVNKQSWSEDLYLYGLVFKENGIVHNLISNTPENQMDIAKSFVYKAGDIYETSSGFTWTKDYILHAGDITASKYTLKKIDGEDYMFLEWKSGDYIFWRLNKPYYYVLKKVSD